MSTYNDALLNVLADWEDKHGSMAAIFHHEWRDLFIPVAEACVSQSPRMLRNEIKRLRVDAERYRWLRNNPHWLGWDHDFRPDEVEREIDAAMKADKEP